MSGGGTADGATTGTLQRAPGVVASTVGEDVLVLPPGAQAVLRLNATAGAVWHLLEQPATVEELVAELAAAFDVAHEQVRDDVSPLLDSLVEQGVLLAAP